MKFKISEVSKILNIPVDTLRYLETKDIVKPSKGDSNNYRYYEAWDINFLTEYKKFRSYDFSVSQVKEILHTDNLDEFTEKIHGRQLYFEEKLKYYTVLKEKNEEYINSLDNITNNLWECSLTKRPEMYYFMHRSNYEYEMKDKFEGIFENWLNYFPLVETIVEMQLDSIMKLNERNDYEWGFAIKKEYAELLNILINDKVKNINATESVYTIICAGEKGSFSLKLLDKAMEFIDKNGFILDGNVIGNLLARVHEAEGYFRYIEVWLPVRRK